MISAGGLYPIAFDVFDASGVLAHATTVTLTITLPDGTTATPVITDTAVSGQYRLAYQTTIPGRYTAHAVTTGPVTSWDDEFDAAATPWPAMVSLADAKSQLNMDVTDHRFDDELRDFIAVGHRRRRALQARGHRPPHRHRRARPVPPRLVLVRVRRAAAAAVLAPVRPGDLPDLHGRPGTAASPGTSPRCGPRRPGWSASWTARPSPASSTSPTSPDTSRSRAHYKRGALVILSHLWETQRGPGTAASGVIGSEEHWRQPGEFFSVPDKAKELLGPPRP